MEERISQKLQADSRLWQYVATIVVNLTSLMNGMCMGWTSPVLRLLQSDANPTGMLPITENTVSLLDTMVYMGAFCSIPVYGILSKHCGRKTVGYVVGLFALVGWCLVLFAQSQLVLLFGRFFLGFVVTGSIILCPMYIGETVDDDIRGYLGAFISMFIYGGTVVSYILGTYLPYMTFNILCVAVPVVYLLTFWWLPESPVYLESKGQHIDSQKVRELLNIKYTAPKKPDLAIFESKNEGKRNSKVLLYQIIDNRGTRMAVIIGLCLMVCNQLLGVIAVMKYTSDIFLGSGTMLLGALQISGACATSRLVDIVGRKNLLVFSGIVTSSCLGFLSLYAFLRHTAFNLVGFDCFAEICVCAYVIGISVGVGSVPFIVIGEIFAPKVKGPAITFCVAMGVFISFLFSRFLVFLRHDIGLGGCYLLFALSCLSSAAFCYYVVPETKNKSLETIVNELNVENDTSEKPKESSGL